MFSKQNTLYTIFFLVCFSFTYEDSLYDFIISFFRRKQPLAAVKAAVRRYSFKIGVLKNCAIFTGKDLRWSLFNKVTALKACNLNKKRLQHRCFSVNTANILLTFFFLVQP